MAVSRGGRPFAAAPRRQLRGRCAIAPCCAQPPWESDVCSLSIPSRHIGVFIRWRVWRVGAEGRAGFFCVCTGGPGRLPGQGAVAERWSQPRRGDGSRTCARSEISAVHFIRWRGGAERRAGFSFCTIRRRRWPLAELRVIADRWPQPRQADGSRTCARSEISAVHFIRWRGGAERRAGFFFLHNSPAALAAGRATG